ncbi:MAG: type VI secretion system baseplate subunit TssK [Acidobacteria bacterium]|nr:type VI secretion system baseplate subunit TssK [Acidobacteriota bacterium]
MRRLQPVIWSKGTFLTPQHLQAQDRYIEGLLGFRLQAQTFRPWGFRELEIDQEQLSNGILQVNRASGLMPDGLAFDIPGPDPAPTPKPLAAHFKGDRRRLKAFLAIPPLREGAVNVSPPTDRADTRYISEAMALRDENTGQMEKSIQVGRKNFRIVTEVESQRGLTVMPLAHVELSAADVFQLDPRFVPPVSVTAASEYLVAIARRIVEILAAKSTTLAGIRREKNALLADYTTYDVANFWLLYTVNSYFPGFRRLFEGNRSHPEQLFRTMLEMAGALTAFSSEIQTADLPVYDHSDLGTCFTDLDEKLRRLLDTVIPRNFITLPLEKVRTAIYATNIEERRFLEGTRLFLGVATEARVSDLINRGPSLIKIGSNDSVDQMVRQALPGLALRHLPNPPATLPVQKKYQYFSLDPVGEAWEQIVRTRSLAAFVPDELPSPRLELVILLPEGQTV